MATNTIPSDQHLSDVSEDHDNVDLTQKQEVRTQRTEADKKMDRVLANRRSARRSRERRKKLQQNLEISVAFLSRQNDELSRENNTLKQELRVLINLVNQLCKQRPISSNALSDAVSLLSQIQTAPPASALTLNAGHGLANPPLSMLASADNVNSADLLSNLTPEQVLAMSQLATNQQNQQQNGTRMLNFNSI